MNKTLCSAAWTDINLNFANRTIRHCCFQTTEPFPEKLTIDFFNNSTEVQKTRNDLLSGIETPRCKICWDDYKLTGAAYRDLKNKWIDKKDYNEKIKHIEIFLDNLCDMSCIYCDETASSKIASEKKIKNIKNLQIDNDLKVFVSFLEDLAKKQNSFNLSFLGGEVTYSKSFFNFVEQLLENKILIETNIEFSILTNCNSSDAAMLKIISLFNRMPNNWYITVAISNESAEDAIEIIRYWLSWDRFIKNFKTYYQSKRINSLLIAPTLTIFTTKTFPNFIKKIINLIIEMGNNKNFNIVGNWVTYPDILSPAYSNPEYKKLIAELKEYINTTNVIKNNKNFIIFLEKLESKIGSLKINDEELDEFLAKLAEQKSDNKLLELKKLL